MVPVGNGPSCVVIAPPGVPFLAFGATLAIHFGGTPNQDAFALESNFTLSSTAPGIHPVFEPVTLQAGTSAIAIPRYSFSRQPDGSWTFAGVIGGVSLQAVITATGTLRYAFHVEATGANLTGSVNPVPVMLTIGDESGATSVTATISH
jgi:hypothetical protein